MPTAFHNLGRKHFLVLTFSLLTLGGTIYFIQTKWWQRWDFDRTWAVENTRIAQEIIQGLEEFKKVNDRYPNHLDELQPKHITKIPSPFSDHKGNGQWFYQLQPEGNYRLGVTACHWVSSYDALVYHSSHRFPKRWRQSNHCFEVGDWLYVVGFSRLQRDEGVAHFQRS